MRTRAFTSQLALLAILVKLAWTAHCLLPAASAPESATAWLFGPFTICAPDGAVQHSSDPAQGAHSCPICPLVTGWTGAALTAFILLALLWGKPLVGAPAPVRALSTLLSPDGPRSRAPPYAL